MGVKLHVVMCVWEEDHLIPAPEGLPFTVYSYIDSFYLSQRKVETELLISTQVSFSHLHQEDRELLASKETRD